MIPGQLLVTTNAPSARDLHTAVWTGSEMIVWGGSNSNYLNTGGRYNPSTDSWTATSTTNAHRGPARSNGSLDRQANDRLGRSGWHTHFVYPRRRTSRRAPS